MEEDSDGVEEEEEEEVEEDEARETEYVEEEQPRMANGKRRADASGELGSELDGPSWEQGAGKRPRTSPKYFEAGAALPPSAAHAERRAQVADEEAVDVGFVFLSKPFCELQLARFREWLMGPHPG